MQVSIDTYGRPLVFNFTVATKRPQRIRIIAFDESKPMTKFTDRMVNLVGERKFEIRMPVTPNKTVIMVGNPQNPASSNDGSLSVSGVKAIRTKRCDVWLDKNAERFIKFAQEFSMKASYLPEGVYKSEDSRFTIKYLPTIVDRKTGQRINTPARIGHTTGNIEVAKDKFLGYTVPMRLVILLHEYAHKWINPVMGKPINDEVNADISALYMYLGMGYPHIDARLVFAYVFYNKDTPENRRRLSIIEEYITRFENGKILPLCN